MKNFLTKIEACDVLKNMREEMLSEQDAKALESIRICLVAEGLGYNLWGTSVENAGPIFRTCEIPTPNSSEDVVANYEAYKMSLQELQKKLSYRES